MVAWVVIDRRHHRQAAPFALPLSNPLLFMHFRTLSQKMKGGRISSKCFSRILSSLESASLKSRTRMKLQTVDPAVLSTRCTYRSSSGRQCRLAIFDPQSGLCANHHADQKQNERADVADILFRDAQDFQTAQGINYSLRCLHWLVGKNRISSRRAHALAYICSLLLRTLPLMAAERKAGITYITNPPEPDPTQKPS